jgi:hypothetical protein
MYNTENIGVMMPNLINIYCDESCHLKNDNSDFMIIGGITCPYNNRNLVFKEIRNLKKRYGLSETFEIKWTKVSQSKEEFYVDLINYFWGNCFLSFKGLLIDKNEISKTADNLGWEAFYYCMYHFLLLSIFNPHCSYNIYMDIKDTRGAKKRKIIFDILERLKNEFNYKRDIDIEKVQAVQSHEVELIQLTDLIIGAIAYLNRGLKENQGKVKVIDMLQQKTGYPLNRTTFLNDHKFYLLKVTDTKTKEV